MPMKGATLNLNTQSQSAIDVYLGNDDVKDWDDEELRRGRRRSSRGTFIGRQPKMIPRACHQELARRMLSRIDTQMQDAMEEVVAELILIAQGKKAATNGQLKAIELMLERVLGKPDVNVNVSTEQSPWQRALQVSVVGTEAEAVDVVEAVIVDEDDVEWGEDDTDE